MSDSLRDQLLKAGFAEPAPKPKAKPKSKSGKPSSRRSSASKSSHTNASSKGTSGATQQPGATSTTPKQVQTVVGYTHVSAQPPKKKKAKKAPAVKSRNSSWSTRNDPQQAASNSGKDVPHKSTGSPADAEQKLVHSIIESSTVKEHKGESVYRFTWQNKIRELRVKDEIRQKLAEGELAITWLRGQTCIIPLEAAQQIREKNEKWRLFINEQTPDNDQEDDHPVPDDLIW